MRWATAPANVHPCRSLRTISPPAPVAERRRVSRLAPVPRTKPEPRREPATLGDPLLRQKAPGEPLLYHSKSSALPRDPGLGVQHGKIETDLPAYAGSADRRQQFFVARPGELRPMSHLHGAGPGLAHL